MRRTLLALAAALALAAPAAAQVNPTNLPANSVLGRLGIGPGPAEAIPFATLGTQLNIAPTFTGPVTITTPNATTTQGLVVSQTTNASTPGGPILLNKFSITDAGVNPSGSANDGFGFTTGQINGVRINYSAKGAGIHGGLGVGALASADVGNIYGIAGGTYTNSTLGSSFAGTMYGTISFGLADTSATVPKLIAIEAEVGCANSASCTNRAGISINSQANTQGSTLDAAIVVSTIGAPSVVGTGNPAPFKKLIALSQNFYSGGLPPIDSAGDFFFSDAAMTVANIFNLANVTVNNNFVTLASGFSITGGGGLRLPTNASIVWNTTDITLGDGGAGTLRQGGGDVASPTAQAFQIAGVAAGTSNTSGVNWTFKGSTSTGSNNGGGFVWQTTPAGSSGSSQNTYATAMQIVGSGNISLGSTETNPQYPLVVSSNTKTGLNLGNVSGASFNPVALFVKADAANTNFAIASYGTGVNPAVFMLGARGTGASPSASQSGDVLGFMAAEGYAATAYDVALASGVYVGAAENHTLTANGTFIAFLTVPTTTTTRAEAGRFQASGGLSVGTTTDDGVGTIRANSTINAVGGFKANSTAGVTQTCTVNQAKTLIFTLGILTGGSCNT